MKISVFDVRVEDRPLVEKWQSNHKDVEIAIYTESLTSKNVDLVEGSDSVCLSPLSKVEIAVFEKLKEMGIKVISQRSAGFDMYDLDKLNELGIKLINVPRYSPNAIGEYVVASALYFTRNLNNILVNAKAHDFRWQPSILSKEMRTMTVGVVGTGNIGRATAKLFKGLGATVIGYDVYKSEEAKELLEYVSLDEIYERSDVITFHVPATDENYHMVDEKAIEKMKDSVVLFNAARGSIVDTKAVLKGLDHGKIKGVALDVYEHEFTIANKDRRGEDLNDPVIDEIIARDDIIYTPHIAFYTETALDNLITFALDESITLLNTGESCSIVNR